MPAILYLAIALSGLCAWALVYWLIVWVRVLRVLRRRPTVRVGEHLPEPESGWPTLSVIIPAHNEEQVIDACCASLRKQDYPREKLEIIFVLDRCTDQTLSILQRHAAEDDRIIIIENDVCPDDWAGKCNAARLGAERASGAYFIFTDADTEFEPGLCRAAVAITVEHDYALVSLLSTLRYRRNFERNAQPVATFNLLKLFPPRHRTHSAAGGRFANGQFMLFPRIWYEKVGGHSAVKSILLEDLAFARRIDRHGGMNCVLLADGMLKCSMYASLDEFRQGWKRIFMEASHRSPKELRKHAHRILLTGIVAPPAQLASAVVGVMLLAQGHSIAGGTLLSLLTASVLAQFGALIQVHRSGRAPLSAIVRFPLGCWLVAKVMLEGADDLKQRRPVRWGGREYILDPYPREKKRNEGVQKQTTHANSSHE